ncbi:MAG: YitT family protein [Bacteroidales bacterium]|nr:YitT family protein [Bacteroidales bacterium]
MDIKKIWAVLRDYFLISVGVFVYVVSWTSFLIPNGIASGGLTGLCTIIEMGTGIPVAWTYVSINALLIIVGSLILGKGFGFRTIYAILLATVLFRVMPGVDSILCLPDHPLYISEKVLIPLIGGLIEAFGISLIMDRGGSTGGTDILALVVNKFYPVSLGQVFIVFDLVIIASILMIPGKTLQDMIYGYIAMFAFSFGIDWILTGRKSTVQLFIFSDHYNEIADYIINVLDRGVTALNAVGWYTQADRKVLLVLVRRTQLHELKRAVKAVDPKAFMSVTPASGVFGEGFEEIKTGLNRKKK